MRILILSSEFPPGPGGIGTHAYQLARYFSGQGHPVLVLTPQTYVNDSERESFNREQSFQIITLTTEGTSLAKARNRAKVLKNALREFHPEIVLVSGERLIWLSAVVLTWKRTPWVVVGHGTEFGVTSGIKAFLTRWSCNQADAVIAVSEYTRSSMNALGINKPQMKVIHNGADAQFFKPLSLSELDVFKKENKAVGKIVLLTVGNVTRRKGQEWVIRALPSIINYYPNLVYWIAGLPTEEQRLKQQAADLGVLGNIRLWGRVDQMTLLNLYNACDLFIMTSQQLKNGDYEGYGIAVIEAALCGKASIVTDNSGLAEAVQDGSTGLLVPQGKADPIADAVLSLINSPETLQKLSQAAQRRALADQTWEQVGKKYLSFFDHILGGD